MTPSNQGNYTIVKYVGYKKEIPAIEKWLKESENKNTSQVLINQILLN